MRAPYEFNGYVKKKNNFITMGMEMAMSMRMVAERAQGAVYLRSGIEKYSENTQYVVYQ